MTRHVWSFRKNLGGEGYAENNLKQRLCMKSMKKFSKKCRQLTPESTYTLLHIGSCLLFLAIGRLKTDTYPLMVNEANYFLPFLR